MKFRKSLYLTGALMAALGLSNCTTTYDSYGRPVQSVDPGMATAGIIGAGLIGYALADNNNDHKRHHHYRHYDRHRYHDGYRYHNRRYR